MNRLPEVPEDYPEYYDGTQYDMLTLCQVIKHEAKLELGDLNLGDFEFSVILKSANFINLGSDKKSLLNNEYVVSILSSEKTIEQMHGELKDKIRFLCTDLAQYSFTLFLSLLFGKTVNIFYTENPNIARIGNVTLDVSNYNNIKLIVPDKESSEILYVIKKKYIYFLYKKHPYSLELLEDHLIENDVPDYDRYYILFYIAAYHMQVLIN